MPGWRRFLEYEVMENAAFGALCRTGRAVPGLIKPLNRLAAATLSTRSYSGVAPGFRDPAPGPVRGVGYAVPRESVLQCSAELRAACPRPTHPVMFPVEVRVAAADDIWLSTAYGRDTAYMAIHQYMGLPYQEYFRLFESIAAAVGGRPHWGKMHTRDAAYLGQPIPGSPTSSRIRDEIDPDRRFANPYLEQVFGA